jgi:DNA sulfur modification protein DndB
MKRLLLPCLRGAIGNWVTYTCLMRLSDIDKLISFADDIHKNKSLSKLIQRQLKQERAKEIGEYLINEQEAFFNSLVVAIYEGEPKWHQFDTIDSKTIGVENFEAPDYALECMGYLSLTRDEKIFALDGQHRLAGIQYALEKNPEIGGQQITVTFLAHFNDDAGLKRTRRLFTTLNKRAKPVNKDAIISLDEDDVCACATRYLVEESDYFSGSKLKYQATNNIAYRDCYSLTTIGNLYDLIKIIMKDGKRMTPKIIDNYLGTDDDKALLFQEVFDVFDYMFGSIPCLVDFQNAENESDRKIIVEKYRNKLDGGHLLFRPLGLKLYLISMCKYINKQENFTNECRNFIDRTCDMDLLMESLLLKDKFWDSVNKKIMKINADVTNEIVNKIMHYNSK